MDLPRLILVTGPGGSGKSTLASRLGQELGAPVISRDALKEGLALTEPGAFGAGLAANLRANRAFFATLDLLLRAQVSLLAEAAFQHDVWWQGLEPLIELSRPVVIRCVVPFEVARQRGLARLEQQAARAAHEDRDYFSVPPPYVPLHLDAPTVDIDTIDGWQPDLATIANFCRAR